MPLTTLDPKTALIVVDLQKGIINSPFIHPVTGVVERTCALLNAFRQRDLPVVLVNVAGGAPGRTEQPVPGRIEWRCPEPWIGQRHRRSSDRETGTPNAAGLRLRKAEPGPVADGPAAPAIRSPSTKLAVPPSYSAKTLPWPGLVTDPGENRCGRYRGGEACRPRESTE